MSKGKAKGVEALIAERNKLRAEYAINRQEQIRLQHKLDRLTNKLMKVVGLEALM
jgi:hypothetical protein